MTITWSPPRSIVSPLGTIRLSPGRSIATTMEFRGKPNSLIRFPATAPLVGTSSLTSSKLLSRSLAMIESLAIYCFVVSMILIFANPFWNHAIATAGGK